MQKAENDEARLAQTLHAEHSRGLRRSLVLEYDTSFFEFPGSNVNEGISFLGLLTFEDASQQLFFWITSDERWTAAVQEMLC